MAGVAFARLRGHPEAGPGATTVMAAVLHAMGWLGDDETLRCGVSVGRIAAAAFCDEKTVRRMQAELERHGLIVRVSAIPRQPVVWRMVLLRKDRPDYGQGARSYGQGARSGYGQGARSLRAESPLTTGTVPDRSLEISSSPRADVVPGAVAPLPPPPDVTGDEDAWRREEWARLAAARATPAQVAWARRYNESGEEVDPDDWPPEWDEDVAEDVAIALAVVNGWP